jgi:hypothetical protein
MGSKITQKSTNKMIIFLVSLKPNKKAPTLLKTGRDLLLKSFVI